VRHPPFAPRRGADPLGQPALRLRAPARYAFDRQFDHAAEEEPGRRRTRARPCRAHHRLRDGIDGDDERPPPRLFEGYAGRQTPGAAVKLAESRNVALDALPLADLQTIDARIDARVFDALSVDASVAARASYGGTAPDQVRQRVAEARTALGVED
jgi:hypothetical protein